MLKLCQKISQKAISENNYARFKPERVKLCYNYAENYVRKSLCQIYARLVVIMPELS